MLCKFYLILAILCHNGTGVSSNPTLFEIAAPTSSILSPSLHLQGVAKNSESLRLLMVAHYLDPPESLSPDLERVTKDMPAWVTDIGWAVSMDEWIF